MLLLTLLVGSFGHVSAGSLESHIYTENRTDVWVWVTAYAVYGVMASKIEGAWCVGPRSFDRHGLHASIREVRFEVTKNHGCAHPVLHDERVFGPPSNVTSSTNTYYVDYQGGRYKILGAPSRAI
jgi:hypothetical protein